MNKRVFGLAILAALTFAACKKSSSTNPIAATRHCHVVRVATQTTTHKDTTLGTAVTTIDIDTTILPDDLITITLLDGNKISCQNETYTFSGTVGTAQTYEAGLTHSQFETLYYYPANDSLSITQTIDNVYYNDTLYQELRTNTFINSY